MSNVILSVQNVSVRRGDANILSRVNWEVHSGENWAILGANGSGKTSLLKALSGYLAPTVGEIELLGESYGDCDWRELRQRVGIVSASIANLMNEEDEALDIVIGGKFGMMGMWGRVGPAERTEARRYLKKVGISYLANRAWLFLSQGERQRVLIARSLMAHPRLLILDEPCSGLDPAARETFLDFVEEAAGGHLGVPLLFVMHHVEEVRPVMTHALILKEGKILAAGPIEKVLNSANLSKAFNAKARVQKRNGRYQLAL